MEQSNSGQALTDYDAIRKAVKNDIERANAFFC